MFPDDTRGRDNTGAESSNGLDLASASAHRQVRDAGARDRARGRANACRSKCGGAGDARNTCSQMSVVLGIRPQPLYICLLPASVGAT